MCFEMILYSQEEKHDMAFMAEEKMAWETVFLKEPWRRLSVSKEKAAAIFMPLFAWGRHT